MKIQKTISLGRRPPRPLDPLLFSVDSHSVCNAEPSAATLERVSSTAEDIEEEHSMSDIKEETPDEGLLTLYLFVFSGTRDPFGSLRPAVLQHLIITCHVDQFFATPDASSTVGKKHASPSCCQNYCCVICLYYQNQINNYYHVTCICILNYCLKFAFLIMLILVSRFKPTIQHKH